MSKLMEKYSEIQNLVARKEAAEERVAQLQREKQSLVAQRDALVRERHSRESRLKDAKHKGTIFLVIMSWLMIQMVPGVIVMLLTAEEFQYAIPAIITAIIVAVPFVIALKKKIKAVSRKKELEREHQQLCAVEKIKDAECGTQIDKIDSRISGEVAMAEGTQRELDVLADYNGHEWDVLNTEFTPENMAAMEEDAFNLLLCINYTTQKMNNRQSWMLKYVTYTGDLTNDSQAVKNEKAYVQKMRDSGNYILELCALFSTHHKFRMLDTLRQALGAEGDMVPSFWEYAEKKSSREPQNAWEETFLFELAQASK